MNYFDSTIRVGYYHAFGLQFADHTYALIDHRNVTWAFPCFGGVAERVGERGYKEVRYPVDMWTPYAVGSRNVGHTLPANLYVALGMAQFSANPSYNFRKAEWDAYWDSGKIDGLASWAGLVYGVSGVCQQACNRILWSTQKGQFSECPVNWPPSFSQSYWVYGYWGKTTELLAMALANLLVAQAHSQTLMTANTPFADMAMGDMLAEVSAPPPVTVPDNLTPAALSARAGQEIGDALRKTPDKAERGAEIRELVTAAPGGEKVVGSAVTSSGVMEIDARFQATKIELDTQLLRGEIASTEYAHQVNAAFGAMAVALRDAMPPETYAKLFPESATGVGFRLIDPALMPANYDRFQETAKV